MSLRNLLGDLLARDGLEVSCGAQEKMILFLEELLRWNRTINLTAISDPVEAVEKHLLDSLYLLPFLDGSETLLDIGSGGGLPAIPLKLARPGLLVTSVDASGKKINFQKHAARILHLQGFFPLQGRIERLAETENHRHKYDVVVSRAFAGLAEFCRHAKPFVREGGRILAMKGAQGDRELDEDRSAIAALGLSVRSVEARELPGERGRRHIIVLSGLDEGPTI